MWADLEQDVARKGRGARAWVKAITKIDFHVLLGYRFCRALQPYKLGRVAVRLLQIFPRALSGCYISAQASIAGGVQMPHPTGIVIGEGVVLGRNATIFQNVTIGSGDLGAGAYPVIGNNVTIFANAVIVGSIKIGDGAKIGAGAVVLKDVPAGRTAVGNPARLLPEAPGIS
ncbi:serine O-acetyltransferase [Brevundimonas nasdae]|uniref:serine O-acetyltransferase n=1 Tax=Brevundimonas nasdae TaxID=172043 RepID=UPI003F691419